MNLTNNALKFTKSGGVQLLLNGDGDTDSDTRVSLLVKDTGIGMDAETMENLFQPFKQGNSSTTREYGGTGLGLAISKKLAIAMKGELTSTSVLGEGSSFLFKASFKPGFAPEISRTEPQGITSRPLFYGRKVLVVEDNYVNQIVVSKICQKLGFGVTTAANGAEGVEAVKATHFDLVLMDCQMPVMDGYDASLAIRAMELPRSRLLIIALTANSQAEDKEKCKDSGMDDFISKPLMVTVLVDLLKKYLPQEISA